MGSIRLFIKRPWQGSLGAFLIEITLETHEGLPDGGNITEFLNGVMYRLVLQGEKVRPKKGRGSNLRDSRNSNGGLKFLLHIFYCGLYPAYVHP